MNEIEVVARTLCTNRGEQPNALEPGDLPYIDGICLNGDPGHYHWRDFISDAEKIITALKKFK